MMNITKYTQTIVLASFFVCITFLWQGNKGFNLWDEGFLWYGAQRVMLGEVPIRDFMAYDPGRYYWSATFMGLWADNGIMALRCSVAIFQAIGLFVGLWLIALGTKNQDFLYSLLSAVTLVVWMYPRHKLFDISLSILLIAVLTFLIQKPTSQRYFFTGLCVGLVAIFGRNHGMYGVVGSIGVILWLNIKRVDGIRFIKGFTLWAVGVVAGFAPLLFMALLIPGFAIAFWESIRFLLKAGTTPITLPVPWPWTVQFASVPFGEAVRGVLVGLFFIFILAFGLLTVIWVTKQKFQDKPVAPGIAAASFLALPYSHYAFTRADIGHLAQGVFPLLIGCFMFFSNQKSQLKWSLVLILCASSVWIMYIQHPGWQCYINKNCLNIEISASDILVDQVTARDVALLKALVTKYASDGQNFIATPYWPGAYALLQRKSPMWTIYALLPRSQAFQQEEIVRIKQADPRFALIYDFPLDGRDELRFQNTNPIIYQYIQNHFEPLSDSPNPAYQIYIAKGNGL